MSFLKNMDWGLVSFLAGSTALDYYLHKHLTWRLILILPEDTQGTRTKKL